MRFPYPLTIRGPREAVREKSARKAYLRERGDYLRPELADRFVAHVTARLAEGLSACEHAFVLPAHRRPAEHLQAVLANRHTTATTVLAAAHDVPNLNLTDALEVCLRLQDHRLYPRAVARWIARLVLEVPAVTITELEEAVDAFAQAGTRCRSSQAGRSRPRHRPGRSRHAVAG